MSHRDEVLTYNYSPLVPDMVGSDPDSWGNIPLSFYMQRGIVSHCKISCSMDLDLSSLTDGQRGGVRNRTGDLGHGLEL